MPYLIIVAAFAADRLSKWWAAAFLAEHGPTRLHAWLSIGESYNRGIAFGLFQGIGPLIGYLSLGVLAGLLFYLRSLPREAGTLRVGLALIIGGAAGNLVDRIGQGQVLDFLMTPLRPGIFNLADVLIYLGLGLAVLGVWLWERPTTAGAMSGATAIPTGPDPPDPPAGP